MSDVTTGLPFFHFALSAHRVRCSRKLNFDTFDYLESSSDAVETDISFIDHRIVGHLAPDEIGYRVASAADCTALLHCPFGFVLSLEQRQLSVRKQYTTGMKLISERHVRFWGEVSEQAAMFFRNRSSSAFGIEAFADVPLLFAE
jgi:extradiol dioxygenase family protein